jgi:hypothetical protein
MPAPSRKAMIAAFRDLDTAYLQCRDWGHPWRYKGTTDEGQEFFCSRCETTKVRELDNRNYPVRNIYRNRPSTYSTKPGIGWGADARAAMRTVLYGDGRL